MTFTLPATGHKVRTVSHRTFALIIDSPDFPAFVLMRSDSVATLLTASRRRRDRYVQAAGVAHYIGRIATGDLKEI